MPTSTLMSDRRTVIEIIATAALEVDIPIDYGDALPGGVETVLGNLDSVRYVVIEELGEVTSRDEQLRVEVYARVTLHFDPNVVDIADHAAGDRLGAADPIASVVAFDIESGPYRIEAW